MKEKRPFQPLTSNDICLIYRLLHNEGIVAFPLTSEAIHKIESLTTNINEPHFGVETYPTLPMKAVAYLYFIIKDHPFTDGNKRTAVLSFLTFCDLNDLRPSMTNFGLDSLAVFLEENKSDDHHIIIHDVAELLFDYGERYVEE